MGEALEVAKVLVEPTMKLLDMVGGAIGTLYEPKHKRKMADATFYEIEQVSEALRKNSDVLVSYNNGDVIANVPEWNDFLARTKHRRICQELINQRIPARSLRRGNFSVRPDKLHCCKYQRSSGSTLKINLFKTGQSQKRPVKIASSNQKRKKSCSTVTVLPTANAILPE